MNTKLSCIPSGLCLLLLSLASCAAGPENGSESARENASESANESSDLLSISEKVSPEFPHCVIEAVSVPAEQAVLPQLSAAPKCFHTYSEATSFATKGRVNLPKDASAKEVDDAVERSGNNAVGPQSIIIAREYLHAGYSLPSLAVTTSSGCGTGNKLYATMPSGWNDAVSSALIYGGTGCFHGYHYEHANFGGASLDVGGGMGNLGAMNDKTSSILWTQ